MNGKSASIRVSALWAFTLLALSGCALFAPTLEDQGIVRIQTEGTERIHFESVNAYAEDEGFELRGTVHRFGPGRSGFISGHVDVLLRVAGGAEKETSEVRLVPRSRPRHTGRKAWFVTRFDALPTRGSVLLVTYHEGSHPLDSSASGSIDTSTPIFKDSAVQPSRSQT